jgi:proteasome lid subunit RPN8/RPN11
LILRLSADLLERIRAHATASYPFECCGAMLGLEDGDEREVKDLAALDNQRQDSPRNRFLVRPEDVIRVDKAARDRGLDVLGWYHSHPDAPARPSEFDREHAWPWYSYLIVSVEAAEPRRMASWRLTEDRTRYDAEEIVAQPSPAAQSGEAAQQGAAAKPGATE